MNDLATAAATLSVAYWLYCVLAEAWKPRPKHGTLEWASKNVMIPAEVSPEFPGFYNVEISPVTEIFFEFFDSDDWDELIFPKSSQLGLSQAAHVCLVYYATFIGKNIALVIDTTDEAKRVCKTRIQPLLKACKALSGKIFQDEDAFSNLTLYLKGFAIFLCGSGSTSPLANKPIGLALADEVDNYPAKTMGDSNALDLLRARCKKVVGAKLAAFSKPKTEDGIIWPEYLTGSRHRCLVPCPHCSSKAGELAGYQTIEWEFSGEKRPDTEPPAGIIRCDESAKDEDGGWDYLKVERTAFMECCHCGGKIRERDKPWMMDRKNRRWIPTNKGQDKHKPKPRKMSAQASDLYSLFPKDTWGKIYVEFLDHQLKDSVPTFRKDRLGLPDKAQKIEVKAADVIKLVGNYKRGELPTCPDAVLIGADVQGDREKFVIAGFWLNGDCRVVDYGETFGMDKLIGRADEEVRILDWAGVPIAKRSNPICHKGIIDEGDGNRQGEIRNFVTRTYIGVDEKGLPDYRFYSTFGRAGKQVKNWKSPVTFLNTEKNGFPLLVYKFDDWDFKRVLYHERIERFREFEAAKAKNEPPPSIPILQFPRGCEARFFKEFESESQIWDDETRRWIWKDPPDGPNDWPDALKMLFVQWYVLRPELIKRKALQEASELAQAEASLDAMSK